MSTNYNSMFYNYDNMDPNHIPNNIKAYKIPEYIQLDNTLPNKLYDIKNNFIGYSWVHGELFNFTLNVNDTIRVPEDSIIYTESGQCPDANTKGYKSQKAYNIVDGKCWTCTGYVCGVFVWLLNDKIMYTADGDKEISLNIDMTNKQLKLDLYTFKWEIIESIITENSDTIELSIDDTLSEKLNSGIYYGILSIVDNDNIHIKDKFTIVIK